MDADRVAYEILAQEQWDARMRDMQNKQIAAAVEGFYEGLFKGLLWRAIAGLFQAAVAFAAWWWIFTGMGRP